MKHIALDSKHIAGAVIILLLIAGASFYGGTAYANGARAAARASFAGGQFAGRAGGARAGGATVGSIVAKDATSITLQMQGGSTKIVLIGSGTQVMKTTAGSVSDLSVGTNVLVTGSANADGSVTAQTISIRPAMPAPASTPAAQ